MKPLNFKRSTIFYAACICALAPASSWAAYDCTVSGSSLNVRYTQGTVQDATGQVTITCTRASTDAATNTYSVGIDQGEPPANRQYTRIGGTDTLRYQIYRESNYATTWNNSGRRVSGNINFDTSLITSFTLPYYLRIPSQTGKPAGTYDDTLLGFIVRIPATVAIVGQDPIALYAVIDPVCSISSPPSNIALNYTAFSNTPVAASTPFSVNCTNRTPYTMALNASSGTNAGILYNLSLSSTSANGTGAPQPHSITATAPAGQAGTCATGPCTPGATAHTITISY
jgi:spore coat protein U-like protein